ncbi:bifunctional riboflavin kinase/FAD synthetase [Pleionea sediminis]|uniref:bifunctional riboflavin kinase/FAD synthetase n=1 Tax=Pleionea sediminis TaxID=2569479 RepID=UPI001184FFF7|nr:bifunctional riboflavin kinase/FAD synthetase [Pleionea sediminis]
MQLIRGLHNLRCFDSGCVATIGKFDGVHLGHQQILKAACERAKELAVPSVVMVFEPDPNEYFMGEKAPARLTCFREKLDLFRSLSIDFVLCLRFDKSLASMPAENFVDDILIEKLRVKHLIVGDDFRFGAQRRGDFILLKNRSEGHFSLQNTDSIKQGTERISSTLVRHKLAQNELSEVESLLGRRFSISGRVSHGDKLGRTIGFPTMNIPLKRKVSPVHGVYLVEIEGLSKVRHLGVANVGVRPTLKKTTSRLEVHVFDFDALCYGKQIKVFFLEKIREEKKFESFEALKHQIALDIDNAKKALKN